MRHCLPLLLILQSAAVFAQHPSDPVFLHTIEPNISVPAPQQILTEEFQDLWLRALRSGRDDLQREIAISIEQMTLRNVSGVTPEMFAELKSILNDDAKNRELIFSTAGALIAHDQRDSAERLFELSQSGPSELAMMIEPALARWNHQPARQVWLDRLDGVAASRSLRVVAIECLATVGEDGASQRLQEFVLDGNEHPQLRLAAARALGGLVDSGLEAVAASVALSERPNAGFAQILAAAMLRGHSTAESERLRFEFAASDKASAALAWEQIESSSPEILALARQAVENGPPKLAARAIGALARQPTADSVQVIALALRHTHADVRVEGRRRLYDAAQADEIRNAVIGIAKSGLNKDPSTVEQAALLLGALGVTDAADRLVMLLDHESDRIQVAAGCGLKMMQAPGTAAAMLKRFNLVAQSYQRRARRDRTITKGTRIQAAHLIEALAKLNHAPAKQAARSLIGNDNPPTELKRAVLWSIGFLFADEPEVKVAQSLLKQINRTSRNENDAPPDPYTRGMAALSLGRMNVAERQLRSLRGEGPIRTELVHACAWALREIAGDDLPAPEPLNQWTVGWFLEPVPSLKEK